MITKQQLIKKFLTLEMEREWFKNKHYIEARLELFRMIEDDIFDTSYVPIFLREPLFEPSIPPSVVSKKRFLIIYSYQRIIRFSNLKKTSELGGVWDLFQNDTNEIYVDFRNSSIHYSNNEYPCTSIILETSTINNSLLEDIEDCFSISNRNVFSLRFAQLMGYLEKIDSLKQTINKLLDSFAPNIIFVASYNPLFKAIIETAKRKSIFVIEMQHGMIDRNHINYNHLFYDKDCLNKYPDTMLLFDYKSKHSARHFLSSEQLCIVGSYINYLAHRTIQENVIAYDYLLISPTKSQIMKECALRLREIDSHSKILYRFHPEEVVDESYISFLKSINIDIQLPKTCSVYEAILKSKNIITYNSTVTYEALSFGKNVIVIEDDNNPAPLELINKVSVIKREEISISNFESKNNTSNNPEHFRKNYLVRLKKAIMNVENKIHG